jgi:outer membrane biosynthesis protein TonB
VTRSLDQVLGLDDEAVAAAMKWSFISGKLNGESVPVRIVLELQFRIH